MEVIFAVETWLDGQRCEFFECLQNLEHRAKKCIELRGEYVGRAKNLSASFVFHTNFHHMPFNSDIENCVAVIQCRLRV